LKTILESFDIFGSVSDEDLTTCVQKHTDHHTPSLEMFNSTQNESEEQTATPLLYQMVDDIGHAIMNSTY